jgi:hypothetical protein
MTLLIDARGKFVTRDLLFENPNVKIDDGFALIFSLEVMEYTGFIGADFTGTRT